jgi:MSHA biogenesis protein MshQ
MMKNTLLILCALLVWLTVPGAQAATYSFRNDVFAYDTPSASATTVTWHASGAAPACTTYPQGDDDWADIVFPSGFTFTFGGVIYSGTRIYSNGILAFGVDNSGYHRTFSNVTLPITAAGPTYSGCPNGVPSNLIIAYWTDIVAGTGNNTTGASVRYELLTDAISGQRRLVISWVNVKLYGQTERYNFQIILYESTPGQNSNFKYQYTTGSSTGQFATIGVQLNAADYTLYSYNQMFIDPTLGSAVLWYPANQLATKGAEYRFDESIWNGTAGEVKDTSGAGQDGVRVGAASNVPPPPAMPGGKLCRGGSFPTNTSNATRDAVATPLVPGNIGSIDFWFSSNSTWNNANAMLLDATTVANRPFYLMKSSTNGRLVFVVSDSAGTVLTATTGNNNFAANTWHHVGVSWNLRVGTNQSVIQIFLDGATTPARTARGTTNGIVPAFSTLYIGDNRTSGVTPANGTPNSANGLIDEVYVYPTEINAVQEKADMDLIRTTCTTLDHFHIMHGGEIVNCGGAVANVTIEAHDVNHALFSLAGTSMTVSTSTAHGTWSRVSAINPVVNGGPGVATYTFSGESSVVLGLANTFFESLNINVVSGAVTEHSGAAATCVASDYTSGITCDGNLNFAQGGVRLVDSAGGNIVNQRAGVASGTYYLQAVKSDCVTPGACTGACVGLFPSGTSTNIDLAFECNNPITCQAGQAVTFTPGAGAGAAGTIAGNINGAITATTGTYTTRALTFNAVNPNPTPAVPFTFSYSDVGQITLWARYPSGGSGTTTISGSSAFVVAPHHFSFSALPTTAIKAGNSFSATITAMNGAATPAATPNFGKETVPESVSITHSRCQPTGTGASVGNLVSSVGAFNNGAVTVNTLSWSEVGNIDLIATLTGANYLGTGLSATGNTGTGGTVCSGGAGRVGPIVPDHFMTTVTHGCAAGSYTYSKQPFAVAITAMNGLMVGGVPAYTPTINYDGSANTSPHFAKAVTQWRYGGRI